MHHTNIVSIVSSSQSSQIATFNHFYWIFQSCTHNTIGNLFSVTYIQCCNCELHVDVQIVYFILGKISLLCTFGPAISGMEWSATTLDGREDEEWSKQIRKLHLGFLYNSSSTEITTTRTKNWFNYRKGIGNWK